MFESIPHRGEGAPIQDLINLAARCRTSHLTGPSFIADRIKSPLRRPCAILHTAFVGGNPSFSERCLLMWPAIWIFLRNVLYGQSGHFAYFAHELGRLLPPNSFSINATSDFNLHARAISARPSSLSGWYFSICKIGGFGGCEIVV